MEKLSVDQVKLLVAAIAKTASSAYAIAEDGHVGPADLREIPRLLAGLRGFGQVDFRQVLPQLSDMDDQERLELLEVFKQHFTIDSETVEGAIEEGFAILLSGIQAVMAFIDIGKKAKV